MPVLLAVVNYGHGTKINRFANREEAIMATKKALPAAADAQNGTETKTEEKTRAYKPVSYEPKTRDQIKQVKFGTKIATLIDLLHAGTTIAEIEKVLSTTGKPVNARAWLGYDLRTVAGYGVTDDGAGNLKLKLPKGMSAPMEHKVVEPKPVPVKKEKPAKEAPAPVETTAAAPAPAKAPAAKKAPAPAPVAPPKQAPKAAAKKVPAK